MHLHGEVTLNPGLFKVDEQNVLLSYEILHVLGYNAIFFILVFSILIVLKLFFQMLSTIIITKTVALQ